MDDDCLPHIEALQALIEAKNALEAPFGFLSSVSYWTDGTLCKMNHQKNGLRQKVSIDSDMSALAPALFATFVSAFIPRQAVYQVGLPIKDFFIWADDMEYTRRLSRIWPCYVVRDSTVLHACPTNEPVNISTDTPNRFYRYRCMYRNEVYVYRREGLRGAIYLFSRFSLHLLRIFTKAKDRRAQRVGILLRSVWDGLFFYPPVDVWPKDT